jgi:23S rRNA (guanosine2251-2'-O)-methyltransferase
MGRRVDDRKGMLMMFGKNSIYGALASGHGVERITFEAGPEKDDRIRAIKDLASKRQIPMEYHNGAWFAKNAAGLLHQGVVAMCDPIHTLGLDDLLAVQAKTEVGRSLVLIDEVTDPHNLGAIMRVAAASGVGGVVMMKDRTSPLTPVVASASAGTVFTVPIAVVANLSYAMTRLKKEGYWLYGLDASAGRDYRKEQYSFPAGFVVGSEGTGMRELTRKNIDFLINIPMKAGVESLNVSTALAVILFNALRV